MNTIRGQFEERMKQLIGELQQRPDVLLFIDEIHLIVGAGSAEGSKMDAANILKPRPCRGEIQIIGATTLKEYRQIERWRIERRFQPVMVDEPTIEETIAILNGLNRNTKNFTMKYTDDAIGMGCPFPSLYPRPVFAGQSH